MAELDLGNTYALKATYEALPPVASFLKDRYFPTNPMTDVFNSDEVLVDYKDGGKMAAPYVLPSVGGKIIARSDMTTSRFTPPLIAPVRSLTIDELKKRGFGESLFSGLTPADRETMITLRDLQDLDAMTTRREEVMAAETMLNSKCVMKQWDGTDFDTEKTIVFYEGETNPNQYAPENGWDTAAAAILDDLHNMVQMLTSKGLAAEDLIVSGDVASAIIHNEALQKLLDINRMNLGGVAPLELAPGAAHVGTLNVYGTMIKIISYVGTYENEAGDVVPYIPAGSVILTAPAAGRGLYGAVTQIEQADNQYHSYPGRRVPKYLADAKTNTRTLTLSSCPVLIPNNKSAWVSAKVTGLTAGA